VQIKQFSADTIDDVLAQVRAELGEDAMILQTKRVVKGGIGGFFGREGVEVTAAAGTRDDEAANREAAASVAVDALAVDEADEAPASAPEPFRRHLDGRLAAAEEAEAPAPAPAPAAPASVFARSAAPFAPGGPERSQAILEAARAAVRQAHEAALESVDESLLPQLADDPDPLPPAAAPVPAPSRARAARRPAARAQAAPQTPLDTVRAELVRAGVEPRYLDPFLEGFTRAVAPFLDEAAPMREAVKEHLAARLPTVRDWKAHPAGHTIAMVGQTGVGKTSAAAGIAGRYRAAGLAVALIAAGPGHHDSLEGHARRLDIQLFHAEDGRALTDLRATLADRDLIVVDTHGRSHQQLSEIEQLAALISPASPDEVHLVMPAATSPSDLGDLQRRFRIAGVNRTTLTKLDETRFLGNLVNVPLRMGKPLAYLSDGTSVPGSLVPADARRVAEALLP
jgi:flagellar biosynthesis protein FlhF